MKLLLQLAFKNTIGAGLRTLLNVLVLSLSFVIIIFYNGMIDGWNEQAKHDSIAWEYGQGQLWHEQYDPFDPFTLQDAHGTLISTDTAKLTPLLIQQATIYPEGRMLPVALKGIPPQQQILELPTAYLDTAINTIPVMIGKRMATSSKLQKGDKVLLRWRDKNGTFDASEVLIVHVFDANVPAIDQGQLWIPLEKLWKMTGLVGEATLWIASEAKPLQAEGWTYKSHKELLAALNFVIQSKKASGSILYLMLLGIALLAIFDTQVLAVFRRQREIGTYIALGMTRWQVAGLFTIEGAANSVLAILLGALYGIPFLGYLSSAGIGMPAASDGMGLAISERIYPVYGLGLILTTIAVLVVSATIVSFFPARRITRMNPIDALKGKLQ